MQRAGDALVGFQRRHNLSESPLCFATCHTWVLPSTDTIHNPVAHDALQRARDTLASLRTFKVR